MKKTTEEWFKEIPLQIRLKATENTRRNWGKGYFKRALNFKCDNLFFAIYSSFPFRNTKEGSLFWLNIINKYCNDSTGND